MEPDPRGSMGLGGATNDANLNFGTFVDAIDYKPARPPGGIGRRGGSVGLLSTAGGVLFI
jgi:alcohol dehydrogenase (cytochrome c)